MADAGRRHAGNVDGPWFVDDRCIECDVARQIAPGLIGEVNGKSVFLRQPETDEEEHLATQALLACPVGALGVAGSSPKVADLYPVALAEGVYYCGFNSPKAYGANAFFMQRPAGNLLIDCPRFAGPLVRRLEALGGIADIFITHRDHPADADRYAAHFGARVWIHEDDRRAAPWATHLVAGLEPKTIAPRAVIVPLPGHTEGSAALLVDDAYLFTGDSLFWSRARQDLSAFRRQCWYDWQVHAGSLERLAREHAFSWVLAGHGDRRQLPADEMRGRTLALVERMRRDDDSWFSPANSRGIDW
jgi:glyoxylase-like metal-dependent hydrolase (beta-lactamase superfamily II)